MLLGVNRNTNAHVARRRRLVLCCVVLRSAPLKAPSSWPGVQFACFTNRFHSIKSSLASRRRLPIQGATQTRARTERARQRAGNLLLLASELHSKTLQTGIVNERATHSAAAGCRLNKSQICCSLLLSPLQTPASALALAQVSANVFSHTHTQRHGSSRGQSLPARRRENDYITDTD